MMTRLLSWTGILLVVLMLVGVPVAAAQSPGLQGGDPSFDATAAEEEGYWYSRYNVGNLAMVSGMGETFMPEPEMVEAMIKMADSNPNDGDTPMPPGNPALLVSVYASGDPHYTQAVVDSDFATQHWDPASFDKTVTAEALGWTIIKEIEWAKQFHVDSHFGQIEDNFGAQWRFMGLVLVAEAKMQGQYALEMLKNQDGLIVNSGCIHRDPDGSAGQAVCDRGVDAFHERRDGPDLFLQRDHRRRRGAGAVRAQGRQPGLSLRR